jgi:hypothetical protein
MQSHGGLVELDSKESASFGGTKLHESPAVVLPYQTAV